MIFIDKCLKKDTPYTPVWMMRQAGRYLPEYMEIRKKIGNFLDMTKNPDIATEITLQPIDILDVDAAILFSDILNLPMEMGLKLRFEKGVGPIFDNPINSINDIENLSFNATDNISYVYDAVTKIRKQLPKDKALIGFSGSPWTIATYMVEGRGSKNYAKIKKMLYTNPEILHSLLAKNSEMTKIYLENQIKAGANAVMIFDSWGGALEYSSFFEFSWKYMKEISSYLKNKYPKTPVILFSKGIGSYLEGIDGEFDVFGVDWATPISRAQNILSNKYVLQGNLEPMRLYNKKEIEKGVKEIAKVMENSHHIFNLGHGILPDVPVENAKFFIDLVKEITKK